MRIKTGVTALVLSVLVSAPAPAALAAPPALAPLASACSVREHGATGVRTQNATAPVQHAIDACHARGGGTVYVPPGEYTTGTLVLKDNVTLWLEAGAVFYLSQDKADFPSERAFVFADGARNIAIRGRGRFDGQARYEWGPPEEQDTEILEEERLAAQAGVDMRRWLRRGFQAMTFVFKRCRDVLVEDVTLVGSTLWNVRLWGCDGVVIRGVTIESDLERAANSDGIDIDGSRNVRISDSRITTGDDAIVLKSGRWRWDGRGESFPTENVVVTNCVLSSSSTAFMIGTESYADFRHIVFSNSVIRDSNKGVGINIQDGATVEDLLVANVTMDLRRRHWNWWGSAEPFYFVLKRRTADSRLGAVRDVVDQGRGGACPGNGADPRTPGAATRERHALRDPAVHGAGIDTRQARQPRPRGRGRRAPADPRPGPALGDGRPRAALAERGRHPQVSRRRAVGLRRRSRPRERRAGCRDGGRRWSLRPRLPPADRAVPEGGRQQSGHSPGRQ